MLPQAHIHSCVRRDGVARDIAESQLSTGGGVCWRESQGLRLGRRRHRLAAGTASVKLPTSRAKTVG